VGDGLGPVVGVLTVVDNQPLVALAHQRVHFGAQFVVGEGAAHHLVVLAAEAAVPAGVDALVTDVQRGEKDDAVAVHVPFQPAGGLEHLFLKGGVVHRQEGGHVLEGETLQGHGFVDHCAHLPGLRRRPGEELFDSSSGDEVGQAFTVGMGHHG